MRLAPAVLVLGLGVVCPPETPALEVPQAPAGRVSDFAGILDSGARAEIEAALAAYERESSTQVVVATFRSLEGEDLVDFTNRVFERWRLGQKKLDNGVLLAVFVADRKARIEVGYGLEGRLTDALSRRILEQELIPRFRARDYAGGIRATCAALVAATRGEYTAPARRRGGGGSPAAKLVLLLAVLVAFLLLGIVRFLAGGHPGITYDARGRRILRRRGGRYAGWGGFGGGFGGGGFGGGFGGGGGGFSGGGGMSGGGGASGSW